MSQIVTFILIYIITKCNKLTSKLHMHALKNKINLRNTKQKYVVQRTTPGKNKPYFIKL